MQNTSPLIKNLEHMYQDYLQKINLTDQAKTRTHQIKAELALIALIYSTASNNNQTRIEERLLEVQKVLDGRLKGQSWLSFLSKTNQVFTLDGVWRQLSYFREDRRQNLIKDICKLKKIIP